LAALLAFAEAEDVRDAAEALTAYVRSQDSETWAVWTDLSVSGADGKGKINPVGQRLLARLIDEGSTTQP
jgi:hypothetical protein